MEGWQWREGGGTKEKHGKKRKENIDRRGEERGREGPERER